jgi:hypothetical protein
VTGLRALDERRAAAVEALCELIVPGSSRVGPAVYVDALIAGMPPPVRDGALASIDALALAAEQGSEALAEKAQTPEFGFIRALAIEAYYSDFVAPGKDGPGAWTEIDFNSPLATRLAKDWWWLGIA